MEEYKKIAEHYSQTFEKHGATPQGLDWSNQKDIDERYKIMLGLIKSYNLTDRDYYPSLLDFGCGYGGFYQFLRDTHNQRIQYSGLDINLEMIEYCLKNYNHNSFFQSDINELDPEYWYRIKTYDYIICNGVFTVKQDLSWSDMFQFLIKTLEKLWSKTNKGLAFNLMSTHVDYEKDNLFHVDLDMIAEVCVDVLETRNFEIKHGYGGLYEYTVYCYK